MVPQPMENGVTLQLTPPAEFDAALAALGQGVPDAAEYTRLTTLTLDAPGVDRLAGLDPFSDGYRQEILDLYVHLRARPDTDYRPERDEAPSYAVPDAIWTGLVPWSFHDASMLSEHLYAWGHIMRHLALPPGGSVLEYGPGSGQLLLMLARTGYRACGVDIDEVAVEGIRRQSAAMALPVGIERAVFGEGFGDERFDAAVFYEAFHHALDFEALLRRLHDRIKPGGRVVLCGEPIVSEPFPAVPYPWGPRLDALSVFCMRRFGWMELGFSHDFFVEAARRAGWRASFHPFPGCGRAHVYVLTADDGVEAAPERAVEESAPTVSLPHSTPPGHSLDATGPMSLIKRLALQVPAIRRLQRARDTLLAERDALAHELSAQSVAAEHHAGQMERLVRDGTTRFYHYNSSFDAEEVMRRHAVPSLEPRPGYLTNFLGVVIDPKFLPGILGGREGEVESIPIPANWHSDIAEWGGALRAVDLARGNFTVVEFGCGWGCWMNNTGAAARRAGLAVRMAGVESDAGHIQLAREACAANGFDPTQIELYRGVAAASPGVALFPRQDRAGVSWGLEPIPGASDEGRQAARRSGAYDEVPMAPLDQVCAPYARVDLLHMNIQGGEADLIGGALATLHAKVAYLVVGTHSRGIEGRLFETLTREGWRLEIERPCILHLHAGGMSTVVDGVQGWRNPALDRS